MLWQDLILVPFLNPIESFMLDVVSGLVLAVELHSLCLPKNGHINLLDLCQLLT